jgi:hypothetical protein
VLQLSLFREVAAAYWTLNFMDGFTQKANDATTTLANVRCVR